MNSFKIKSIDSEFVIVDFTVNSKVKTMKYDARYMPIADAEALSTRLNDDLLAFTADAEVVEIPAEVKALVNKKVDLVEPAIEQAQELVGVVNVLPDVTE